MRPEAHAGRGTPSTATPRQAPKPWPRGVDHAAESAWAAFRDYSRRSDAERAQFLRRIAEGIESLGDSLIQSASRETGLPEGRLKSERARTCTQLRLFADFAEAGTWIDERVDPAESTRQPPKPRVRSVLRPLGPVAVFGASRFTSVGARSIRRFVRPIAWQTPT